MHLVIVKRAFFPEAFINMLAFLGWNPGTEQELFSMDELIASFKLERVGKSGAKFDADKTRWYNQQYLRSKPNEELVSLLIPHLDKASIEYSSQKLVAFVDLMKERAVFVEDMLEGRYLYEKPISFDEQVISKKWKDTSADTISEITNRFEASSFDPEELNEIFSAFLKEKELGMGAVLPLLRVLLSGKGAGPSLFDIMAFLGKQESIARLKDGVQSLSNG